MFKLIDEFGVTSFKIFMFYGGHGLHGASSSQHEFLMIEEDEKYDIAHFEFVMRGIQKAIAMFPDKQEESVESSADDHIDQVDEVVNEKNPVKDDNHISMTFDIVRITAQGDTVMAGKTSPNSNIQIFDGEEKLASVFSDPNGEWIWVSDFALKKGIKKFNLKHTDKFGIEHNSDQNIIVFLEGDVSEQPIIVKYSDDGPGWAEILNKQNVVDQVLVFDA